MIKQFGWNRELEAQFAPFAAQDLVPARVTAQHRDLWRLVSEQGELAGRLSGRFAADAVAGEYPVVGDWLAVSPPAGDGDALVHALLPRKSRFVRRAAGENGVQVIAANIDVAFLVAALTDDLNPRRLERYLVAARDSGAAPVIVLTKADLSSDLENQRNSVEAIAAGAPVAVLSALTGDGLDGLKRWLQPSVTAALLGSSGAGKSTLLNALLGQSAMSTGATRESDDRGRHTTTHRELFQLENGALLIDTPGMREFGIASTEESLDLSFDDVATLIQACRFTNCAHETEPDCAILAALADGSLSAERWHAYLKLQRELTFTGRRDERAVAFAARNRKARSGAPLRSGRSTRAPEEER
ncbi:MAG: ribosome small subunit-dependent GTPase A [Alphaproteobacteria bacterium]